MVARMWVGSPGGGLGCSGQGGTASRAGAAPQKVGERILPRVADLSPRSCAGKPKRPAESTLPLVPAPRDRGSTSNCTAFWAGVPRQKVGERILPRVPDLSPRSCAGKPKRPAERTLPLVPAPRDRGSTSSCTTARRRAASNCTALGPPARRKVGEGILPRVADPSARSCAGKPKRPAERTLPLVPVPRDCGSTAALRQRSDRNSQLVVARMWVGSPGGRFEALRRETPSRTRICGKGLGVPRAGLEPATYRL